MSIWTAPNVAYRARTQDLAAARLAVDPQRVAPEEHRSIARPDSLRPLGESVDSRYVHGMAVEVLGDTKHRSFNSADIGAN